MPAHNEEAAIAKTVLGARRHADAVLVVDDGSKDETAAIAEALGAIVVRHETNRGYGGALQTIFSTARRLGVEELVIIDADGQHDPAEIPGLLAALREGNDVVIPDSTAQSVPAAYARRAIDLIRPSGDGVEPGAEIMALFRVIQGAYDASVVCLNATAEMKVSDILARLCEFKEWYLDRHIVPNLNGPFDTALFNTFRSFIEPDHFPVYPEVHADDRGYLAEVLKELSGGQVFFSVTRPGITRGNHFHMRKVERFCVVQGEAVIRLRKIGTDQTIEYHVQVSKPSFVDIPVYYTHNITNVGTTDVLTLFWTNELFDPADPDTFYEGI
jgi:UDP-2-acetamido-2,6-beta-L-arabino-hexul-4-ose reductase